MSMVLQVLLVAKAIEPAEERPVFCFGEDSLVPTGTASESTPLWQPALCHEVDEDCEAAGRLRKVDGALFVDRVVVVCEVFATPFVAWLFAMIWHLQQRLVGSDFMRKNANARHITKKI